MDSAILDLLLKNGITGVLFVIITIPLGLYARHLASNLKEVQDRRAADAQQIVDKLLALNDKWNQTVSQHISTVEAIDLTLKDVKTALSTLVQVQASIGTLTERFSEHTRRAEDEMRDLKLAVREALSNGRK